jgi:hypothetical protein
MAPAGLKALVEGSNRIASARYEAPSWPPATRTWPSGRLDAAAPVCGVGIAPIPLELKVLVAGSKTSALARSIVPL